MKHRILYLLVAVLTGFALLSTTSCTSGRQQQLESAVEAMNRDYPMPIDEGVTLQSINLDEQEVTFVFTIQEAQMTNQITQESLEQWRPTFITLFGTMVHENPNIDQLFRLIRDTEHVLCVQLVTMPSSATYTIKFAAKDLASILEVNRIPQAQ